MFLSSSEPDVTIDAAPLPGAAPQVAVHLPDPALRIDTPAGPTGLPPSDTRRPSTRLIIAAALTTVLAAATVTYATTHSERADLAASSPGTGTTPATAPTTAVATPSGASSPPAATVDRSAAAAWLAANVPPSAPILTGSTLARRLLTLGFTRVRTAPSTTAPDYVVLRRSGAGTLSALVARSVPVARFGTGTDAIEVRSVLDVAAGRVTAVLAADLANRRTAGRDLARNPRVITTDAVRAVLRAGRLDLRAATFLAVIAARTPVRITAAPVDDAQAALARPVRVLTIRASDTGVFAVRAAAAELPTDYAPSSIDSPAPGSLALTWSPDAQPVEPVS